MPDSTRYASSSTFRCPSSRAAASALPVGLALALASTSCRGWDRSNICMHISALDNAQAGVSDKWRHNMRDAAEVRNRSGDGCDIPEIPRGHPTCIRIRHTNVATAMPRSPGGATRHHGSHQHLGRRHQNEMLPPSPRAPLPLTSFATIRTPHSLNTLTHPPKQCPPPTTNVHGVWPRSKRVSTHSVTLSPTLQLPALALPDRRDPLARPRPAPQLLSSAATMAHLATCQRHGRGLQLAKNLSVVVRWPGSSTGRS